MRMSIGKTFLWTDGRLRSGWVEVCRNAQHLFRVVRGGHMIRPVCEGREGGNTGGNPTGREPVAWRVADPPPVRFSGLHHGWSMNSSGTLRTASTLSPEQRLELGQEVLVKNSGSSSLPYQINCLKRVLGKQWYKAWMLLAAHWWGVQLGMRCSFHGRTLFERHPGSRMCVGPQCEFRSSPASNRIGINRPCMISTLREGAEIEIGAGCGFSGTVIACARSITIGNDVRCGANTLIMDTDWHTDDPRVRSDAPVIIGANAWLSVNVTVLKGVTIGENTLLGAGSVVTRSLPPNVVAAGSPARVLREIDDKDYSDRTSRRGPSV